MNPSHDPSLSSKGTSAGMSSDRAVVESVRGMLDTSLEQWGFGAVTRVTARAPKREGELLTFDIFISVDISEFELPFEIKNRIGEELQYDVYLRYRTDSNSYEEIVFSQHNGPSSFALDSLDELRSLVLNWTTAQWRLLADQLFPAQDDDEVA